MRSSSFLPNFCTFPIQPPGNYAEAEAAGCLTFHLDRQGLEYTEDNLAIEWHEAFSGGIDGECDTLWKISGVV